MQTFEPPRLGAGAAGGGAPADFSLLLGVPATVAAFCAEAAFSARLLFPEPPPAPAAATPSVDREKVRDEIPSSFIIRTVTVRPAYSCCLARLGILPGCRGGHRCAQRLLREPVSPPLRRPRDQDAPPRPPTLSVWPFPRACPQPSRTADLTLFGHGCWSRCCRAPRGT